jgi:predicted nucleic acid-binding protein
MWGRRLRRKLYLDTSVLGALTDPGPQDRVAATRRLLRGLEAGFWEGYISPVLLEEVERAPKATREEIGRELEKGLLTVLGESPESMRLSEMYIAGGAVPAEYDNDARHIAVATVHHIPVIVSWNFRHLVNIETKRKVNSVNLREGYALIDLVSPWEVVHEEE